MRLTLYGRGTVSAILALMAMLSVWARDAAGESPAAGPVGAAERLLARLTPDQRTKTMAGYEEAGRTRWNFVPMERAGLPVKEMDAALQEELWRFLGTVLSPKGVEEARGVIRLEGVLRDLEKSAGRDPGAYLLCFWGKPSLDSRWGWRFEGHHLSLNVSLEGDRVTGLTPVFIGANPARVLEGESMGFRNLPLEEDLAWEFLASLGKVQKQRALIDDQPLEVVGAEQATIEPPLHAGLAVSELDAGRREVLGKLLEAYLDCFNPGLVADLGRPVSAMLNDPSLVFQWHGAMAKGGSCSYRICGRTVDIQFSDRQNNANHVHTLVFFPGADFGLNHGGK